MAALRGRIEQLATLIDDGQRFSISERSGEWVKAEAQKKQKRSHTESESGGGEAMTEEK